MSKSELKLVKSKRNRDKSLPKIVSSGTRQARRRIHKYQAGPPLTPAEASEAARFKALTAAKAAQQAMLRRIMAELESTDDISPAA